MVGQEFTVRALPVCSAGLIGLFAQAPEQDGRSPWWLFWLLIILGLLGVLGWWWSSRGREEPAASEQITPAPVKPEAIQASPLHAAAIPTAPVATEDTPVVEEEVELPEIELPAVEVERFEVEEIEPPVVEEVDLPEVEVELPAVEEERFAEAEIEPPAPPVMKTPQGPDDLTIIEGIGPKISGVLQAAGISTFGQLAQTDISRLEEILRADRNLKLANPRSWPEQARLAAAGDWQGLQALQHTLRAGREIG